MFWPPSYPHPSGYPYSSPYPNQGPGFQPHEPRSTHGNASNPRTSNPGPHQQPPRGGCSSANRCCPTPPQQQCSPESYAACGASRGCDGGRCAPSYPPPPPFCPPMMGMGGFGGPGWGYSCPPPPCPQMMGGYPMMPPSPFSMPMMNPWMMPFFGSQGWPSSSCPCPECSDCE